jgi:hypothetical protein
MLPSDGCKHTGVTGMRQENQTSFESKFCCFSEAHKGEYGTVSTKYSYQLLTIFKSSPQGYLHNSTTLDKAEW